MKKTALIIGGSSGIGFELIKYLLKDQYTVYNASRSKCLLNDVINITYDAFSTDIDDVFSEIKERKIDLFVYASGFSMSSPVEALQENDIRYLFEVNYFGVLKLLKRIIPMMKINGDGKIILFSSIASYLNIPYDTLYSSSKINLNYLAIELNNELNRFGVFCKAICIGPTKTQFSFKRKIYSESNIEYGKKLIDYYDFQDATKALINMEQKGMKPMKASKKIYKIINKMDKKKAYPMIVNIGAMNKLYYIANKLLPFRFINMMISKKYYLKK